MKTQLVSKQWYAWIRSIEPVKASGRRARQANPEVVVQFCLVQIATNKHKLVDALFGWLPWLTHAL